MPSEAVQCRKCGPSWYLAISARSHTTPLVSETLMLESKLSCATESEFTAVCITPPLQSQRNCKSCCEVQASPSERLRMAFLSAMSVAPLQQALRAVGKS
eukprot:6181682-Pleurochrysis_carterae.AAC.4